MYFWVNFDCMCAFKSCQSVKKVSRSWLNLPALVHRWLSLFFRGRGAFSNRVSTLPCEKVFSHKIVYIFGSGLTVCVLLKAVKTWRKFQGVGQWHCIKFYTCISKQNFLDIPLKVWNFTKTISHLSLGDYRYIQVFNDNHLD